MTRVRTSALAITLVSVTVCSGAWACNPEGLGKNFTSQREVESQWQEFVIEEHCVVLRGNPADSATLELLRAHFDKGHEGNSLAQGTIDGCSAEQIIEAACYPVS